MPAPIRSKAQQLADEIGVDNIRLLPRNATTNHIPVPHRKVEVSPHCLNDATAECRRLEREIAALKKLRALQLEKERLQCETRATPGFMASPTFDRLTLIAEDFIAATQVTLMAIKGPSRHAEIVAQRHLFFKHAHDAGYTLSDIARFTNRVHGSVSHGLKKFTTL